MKRLLYIVIALLSPLLMAQSTVVCTTASPGTVIGSCAGSGLSSPVTTDPVSATGVWTFDNAANTPVTLSDGASGTNLTGTTSVCSVGAPGTANSVCLGSSVVSGEGTTAADGFQTNLSFGDATADNQLQLTGTATGLDMTATTGSLRVHLGTGTGRGSLGGVICKGAPAQATTGTAEEVLATCAIPANTLTALGAKLEVSFLGHTAANANNKTVKVRVGGIGGTVVYSSLAVAMNNSNFWALEPATIARLSATTATTFGYGCYLANATATSGCTALGSYSDRAAAITWANANDLVITGTTPTAAGDLTLDSYSVEVVQ